MSNCFKYLKILTLFPIDIDKNGYMQSLMEIKLSALIQLKISINNERMTMKQFKF